MRPLLHRLLLGATAVALLTSCTTNTAGQATPAPGDAPDTSSTTTPSEEPDTGDLPTDGAPEVDDPLDTTKFQKEPCLSLTSDQSEGIFGLSASGRPFGGELGNACEWKNESTGGQAELHFLDKYPRGLSAQYAAENEGKWAFFEELTVQGYPAVARGLVDRRADGGCTVVIGASNEIAFEIPVQLSRGNEGKKDACAVAADVAGEAVTTMKAG